MLFNIHAPYKYQELFKQVISIVLGLSENKKPLMSRLFLCNTYLKEASTSEDISNVRLTSNGYDITIYFEDGMDIIDICFQFAHEVGHLMLMPLSGNKVETYSSFDSGFAITTLTRKDRSGMIYGTVFEEAYCNWLAEYVISTIFGSSYKKENEDSLNLQIYLFNQVVDSFTICSYDKWDECIFDNLGKNILLKSIIDGDLTPVIERFDSVLGKGSWRNLMYNFYKFILEEGGESYFLAFKSKLMKFKNGTRILFKYFMEKEAI